MTDRRTRPVHAHLPPACGESAPAADCPICRARLWDSERSLQHTGVGPGPPWDSNRIWRVRSRTRTWRKTPTTWRCHRPIPQSGEFKRAGYFGLFPLNPQPSLSDIHPVRVPTQDPRRSWAAWVNFKRRQRQGRQTTDKRHAPRNCPGPRGLNTTGLSHGCSGPDSSVAC